MIDLHTHILPFMDDGSANTDESLTMLTEEKNQGIEHVALTPHFYPWKESVQTFLSRRNSALQKASSELRNCSSFDALMLPKYILGAEVAWVPSLIDMHNIDKLCYEGTDIVQIELPMFPWSDNLSSSLSDFCNFTGLQPFLAHFDRYIGRQSHKHINEVLSLGFPIQLSTHCLMRHLHRNRNISLLKKGAALVSDCHSSKYRSPDLKSAHDFLQNKFGSSGLDYYKFAETVLPASAVFHNF